VAGKRVGEVRYAKGAWNLGKFYSCCAPDSDDPRRCQAFKTRRRNLETGELGPKIQCRRWRVTGECYCETHLRKFGRGKKQKTILGTIGNNHAKARRVERLPMAYSKTLSKALIAACDRHRDTGLDLTEELILTRAAADEAVQMFDAVLLGCEAGIVPPEKQTDVKLSAAAVMKSALVDVAAMAQRAASVAESKANMLSGLALSNVLAEVIEATHAEFGDDQPDRVKALADRIKKIKMPTDKVEGTMITPDVDVTAMDATIPKS
jgi:hypothetical protein